MTPPRLPTPIRRARGDSSTARGDGDALPDPAGTRIAAHAASHGRAVARPVAEEVRPQHVARVGAGGTRERAARAEPPQPVTSADAVDEPDDLALGMVESGAARR